MSIRLGFVCVAAAGLATTALAQPRYVDSSGVIRNNTTSGTRGGGFYSILAEAFDNRAIPAGDNDTKAGAYPAPPFTNTTRVATVTGMIYAPAAQAQINTYTRSFAWWGLTDGWNSGTSYATLGRLGPTGTNPAEFARANSIVNDPNSYQVLPGQNSVTLSLVFGAGAHLSANADSNESSSASMSGNEDTSLVPAYAGSGSGSLFNFSWSLSSATPGATQFSFTSNPALGLNDSMITSAFLSNVSGSSGDFSLMSDFVIQCTLSATEGSVYTFGGTTQYAVQIQSAPTPGSGVLAALGVGLAVRRRRR